MCGICGVFNLGDNYTNHKKLVEEMAETLRHRGPDAMDTHVESDLALGFARLSIIDLNGGMQPLSNEDGSLIMVCNGEIFNYIELREDLIKRGHIFKTKTDVEVLLHLYEDYGVEALQHLNGQFAFALYDKRRKELFCARDHFGIAPFYYATVKGCVIFASEIKSLLKYPYLNKAVDLVALDQVFSFPGLISPRTIFKDVKSLENGHYLIIKKDGSIINREYWDLVYAEEGADRPYRDENAYIEELDELITRAVRIRLRSDVPVGLYLSGGLDSSLIADRVNTLEPGLRKNSFSIDFAEKDISEGRFQHMMAARVNSRHHEMVFSFSDIADRLSRVIYHCECPIKESYNTASLALSELVRKTDMKVILTGEGADEWFAGYVGYRFDRMRGMRKNKDADLKEEEMRKKLWGDRNFFYEKEQVNFRSVKGVVYSDAVCASFKEHGDSLDHFVVNKERLHNRDILHKRSYLDYKLRMVDHLISDHGDRMVFANSVEARYPFLDKEIAAFTMRLPVNMKLNNFQEKYILKKIAERTLPSQIVRREKFGFVAPGSSYLLQNNVDFVNNLLAEDRIKKQGYFDVKTVARLKKQYSDKNFKLNVPFDSDLLMIVLTFNLLTDIFKIPDLG